jgi:hypothetical protein
MWQAIGMTRTLTLSDTDYAQVAARYNTEANPRLRERLHCLLHKNQGHTNTEIASSPMVCPETITVWLDTFEQQGLRVLCRMDRVALMGRAAVEAMGALYPSAANTSAVERTIPMRGNTYLTARSCSSTCCAVIASSTNSSW